MTTFSQVTILRDGLNAERVKRLKEFNEFDVHYKNKMGELAEIERLLIGGFDVGRIERSRKILSIRGFVTKPVTGDSGRAHTERTDCLLDAKNDLANGYPHMKEQYFGVKNYGGFGDQREDHQYGYRPKHGSIVFSIGFTNEAQEAIRAGGNITEQEIEDCLYLLSVLPQTEKTQSVAA